MAKNQTGIAIVIKAFLPTGSTIDEQFAALSLVKDAHTSGDYTALLKAAKVDEVKTEQKTRRVEDEPAATEETTDDTETTGAENAETPSPDEDASGLKAEFDAVPTDENVPAFIKNGKRGSSAA